MKLAINASRARSGGAYTHLKGLLSEAKPEVYGFSEVHLWAHSKLLETIPDYVWLRKHRVDGSNKSISRQLFWERIEFHKLIKANNCSLVLNVDAGTVCRFRPSVTMSRDMLSYEPGEMARYGISKARLRLFCLKFVQNASLKAASGVIFLTRYAGLVIQKSAGEIVRVAHIPHGVSSAFKSIERNELWSLNDERAVRCLYVSNVAPYKHQWHVVHAVKNLKEKGVNLTLTLTGGGAAARANDSMRLLEEALDAADPDRKYIKVLGYVDQEDLPSLLSKADIFVFASSCENMPNTLVEAMASGLPIACSDRGPMPEVLQDAGVYFNPEDYQSIASAIEMLITNSNLRMRCAARARELAEEFSWSNCADRTFRFLSEIASAQGARK